jgi:hypothetical protein
LVTFFLTGAFVFAFVVVAGVVAVAVGTEGAVELGVRFALAAGALLVLLPHPPTAIAATTIRISVRPHEAPPPSPPPLGVSDLESGLRAGLVPAVRTALFIGSRSCPQRSPVNKEASKGASVLPSRIPFAR